MMLNIISGGRLLVCQLLELNQLQRPYVLAAEAWVFLNNPITQSTLKVHGNRYIAFFFLHMIFGGYWIFGFLRKLKEKLSSFV